MSLYFHSFQRWSDWSKELQKQRLWCPQGPIVQVIAKHQGIAVGMTQSLKPAYYLGMGSPNIIHLVSHWGWFMLLGLPHYDIWVTISMVLGCFTTPYEGDYVDETTKIIWPLTLVGMPVWIALRSHLLPASTSLARAAQCQGADKRREGCSTLLVHDRKGWKWVNFGSVLLCIIHIIVLQIYCANVRGVFWEQP